MIFPEVISIIQCQLFSTRTVFKYGRARMKILPKTMLAYLVNHTSSVTSVWKKLQPTSNIRFKFYIRRNVLYKIVTIIITKNYVKMYVTLLMLNYLCLKDKNSQHSMLSHPSKNKFLFTRLIDNDCVKQSDHYGYFSLIQ